MRIVSWTVLLSFLMIASGSARAHFVWITATPAKGSLEIEAGFGEPGAWDKDLAGKIKQGRYLVRHADGAEREVKLKLDSERGVFKGTIPGDKPVALLGLCDYGVTTFGKVKQPALLRYVAKTMVARPAEWNKLAGIEPLSIEVVPYWNGAAVELTVLFGGAPKAGAEVKVTGPTSKRRVLKTDANGRAVWEHEGPGDYSLFVGCETTKSGEFEREKYESIWDYATLSFHLTGQDIDSAHVSQPTTGDQWPLLPDAITAFGACVLDGYAYVYGGHTGKTHAHSSDNLSKGFHRIRMEPRGEWESLPMGTPLQSVALLAHGGKIHRLGGMLANNRAHETPDMRSVGEVAGFDPTTKTWTPETSLPRPRSSHDAAIAGSKVVVVGGWNLQGAGEDGWLDDALILDTSSPQPAWRSIPQPFRRRALTAVAYQNKIYVLGGFTEDNTPSLEVDILDVATERWEKGPALPGNVSNGFACAGCVIDGVLVTSAMDGKAHRLDGGGQRWAPIGELRIPRFQHRMLALSGRKAVAIGGAFTPRDHLRSIEFISAPRE